MYFSIVQEFHSISGHTLVFTNICGWDVSMCVGIYVHGLKEARGWHGGIFLNHS